MTERINQNRVGKQTNHNGWRAQQNIVEKTHNTANLAFDRKLSKPRSGKDADRRANHNSNCQKNNAANKGVAQAAAFSTWRWSILCK